MTLPRPVLVVLGLYPLMVMAWLTAWDRDVLYLATFDDIFRIQHAWEAGHGAIFPTELWPPLPFWIVALPLRLWPDGHLVPQLCGVLATTLSLGCLAGIALELGLSAIGAATVALVAGVLPWTLYLAPSALAEPYAHLFLLFAAWSWLRVERGAPEMGRVLLGIVAATMCRYESWAFAAIFSWWAWRRGDPRNAALPWVFPTVWVLLELAWTGNPVNFGREAVVAAESDFGYFGGIERLPAALVGVFGPVVAFAVAGWSWVEARPGARTLSRVAGVYLLLVVVAWLGGLTGIHNAGRHLLLPGMLLAVPAAALFERVREGIGALPAGALVVAAVQLAAFADEGPPDGVDDHVSVLGRRLRSMMAAGEIAPGQTILIDVEPIDCFALRIASGSMSRTVFDRDAARVPTARKETRAEAEANPSVFELPRPELERWLKEQNVGAILAYAPDHQRMAGSFGRQVDFQGGWSLVDVDR